MRVLRLTEYLPEPGVALSVEERDLLRKLVPSMNITPSSGHEGRYDLVPGSYIGAVNLGSLSIAISPKIPVSRALFLISYALDRSAWMDHDFNFTEESSLLEALIPGFVRQVRRALRRGPLEGYRTEDESLNTMRGRLRVGDQIRRRYGAYPPVEVTHDEFTEDIEENRQIKAALHLLSAMRLRSERFKRSLRHFDTALERVRLVRYDRRKIPEIRFTRLNEHYRPAIELAQLILRACSIELGHGLKTSTAFLLDMNKVFEDFVAVSLREALGVSERDFPQNARGRRLYLDKGGRIRLEPDISWWGQSCIFVGDVKYKNLPSSGGINDDLYQLLAYTVACGLPGGLLIYGSGTPSIQYEVVNAGKSLRAVSVDLSQPPEDILQEIHNISGQIRQLCRVGPSLGSLRVPETRTAAPRTSLRT